MANYPGAHSTIPKHIYHPYIVENFYRNNKFLKFATDESSYVGESGLIVHIPQAGAKPNVVRNRAQGVAVNVFRADSDVVYALDSYTTDPCPITWQESSEISYNKTDSVIGEQISAASQAIADNILYRWYVGLVDSGASFTDATIPASNIMRTSGAAEAVNPYDGQTGTRNALTEEDLSKMQAMFDKNDVTEDQRYIIIESYMYKQLIKSLSTNAMTAYRATNDLEKGIIGKLHGFNIIQRSRTLATNAAGTSVLQPGQALAATSNIAALAFATTSVSAALGKIKMFQSIDDPNAYGNIYSVAIRGGGRCRRADWAGVGMILQQ